MTFSLLDQTKARIDDARLGRLGRQIGVDGSTTAILMSGALPGLLHALSGAAHRPGGAQALFERVTGTAEALLDERTRDQEVEALDALTGRAVRDRLAEALMRFAGIDADRATTLLGKLLPFVSRELTARVHEQRLDTDGLATLLLDQRNEVDAAMPPAFTDQLQALGFFDAIIDPTPVPAATGRHAAMAAPSAAPPTAPPAGPSTATPAAPPPASGRTRSTRQTLSWVIALLALLLLAFAGMRFTGQRAAEQAQPALGAAQPFEHRLVSCSGNKACSIALGDGRLPRS